MKRLFIAVNVEPGTNLTKALTAFRAGLAFENIRWVDNSGLHLTLAFLGDTEEDRIRPLSMVMKQKCSGVQPFEFILKGSGIFRNRKAPKVIWLGAEKTEQLYVLYNSIREGLDEAGFVAEGRQFSPHLTIGRIKSLKDRGALETIIAKYRETEFQTIKVESVILYQSILLGTGPVYKVVDRFRLS